MNNEEYKQKFAQSKIDLAVSGVHDPDLTVNQLKESQRYLVEVRRELSEPNANISKVDCALSVLSERLKIYPSWKDWFLKPVITNIVIAIASGAIGYLIGKLPKT
ncbi:hypothetical protein [Niveibacterium terrae]|uniref:hypothetical protein n=1 Tax=Niveibacterium terrae TaxID=3373598 RepID=UPI003A8E6E6A